MRSPSPGRKTFAEFNAEQANSMTRILSHAPRRVGTYVHIPSSTVIARTRRNAVLESTTETIRKKLSFLDTDSEEDTQSSQEIVFSPALKNESVTTRRNARRNILNDDSGVFLTPGSSRSSRDSPEKRSSSPENVNFLNYRFRQLSSESDDSSLDTDDETEVVSAKSTSRTRQLSAKNASKQPVNAIKKKRARIDNLVPTPSPVSRKRRQMTKNTPVVETKTKRVPKRKQEDDCLMDAEIKKMAKISVSCGRKSARRQATSATQATAVISEASRDGQKSNVKAVKSTSGSRKSSRLLMKTKMDPMDTLKVTSLPAKSVRDKKSVDEFSLIVVNEPSSDGRPLQGNGMDTQLLERDFWKEKTAGSVDFHASTRITSLDDSNIEHLCSDVSMTEVPADDDLMSILQ